MSQKSGITKLSSERRRTKSNYAEVVVRRQEADMTIWPT
jgi:hypothetical protein